MFGLWAVLWLGGSVELGNPLFGKYPDEMDRLRNTIRPRRESDMRIDRTLKDGLFESHVRSMQFSLARRLHGTR
jgi:hypothetical protein